MDGHIEIVLGAKWEHLLCLSVRQEPRAMPAAEGKGVSLPFATLVRDSVKTLLGYIKREAFLPVIYEWDPFRSQFLEIFNKRII